MYYKAISDCFYNIVVVVTVDSIKTIETQRDVKICSLFFTCTYGQLSCTSFWCNI